jgi:hypothetical protein
VHAALVAAGDDLVDAIGQVRTVVDQLAGAQPQRVRPARLYALCQLGVEMIRRGLVEP